MIEEITAAALAYRETKDSAPEASASRKAAQLDQAAANYAYYSRLAGESLAAIRALTGEIDDGKDEHLAIIAQALAAVDALAEPAPAVLETIP